MIGAVLKELRQSKNYTIAQLCDSIDMNPNTYAKYERGERDVSTEILSKFADFYGVTTDYLLGREPAPNPFADFNLSEADEKEVIDKYMSLPPEIRACVLDVLVQLGDAAKKRKAAEPEMVQKTITVRTAARSIGDVPIANVEMTKEEYEEIRNSPDVDPDL